VKFYHGGVAGLSVGDLIVPRQDHPVWRTRSVKYNGKIADSFGDNGKTVSLTKDLEIARAYAGEYVHYDDTRKPGQVYEVEPLRRPYADLDFPTSFPEIARCNHGAEIVAVLDVVEIAQNPRVKTKALATHMFMTNLVPVYDEQGYINYTPALAKKGYTRDDLRSLGPWMPFDEIDKGVPMNQIKVYDPL